MCFIQFAEKLKSGLPPKDMKLQLLQDIAAESSLEWNSKALENKLFRESYDKVHSTNNLINLLSILYFLIRKERKANCTSLVVLLNLRFA